MVSEKTGFSSCASWGQVGSFGSTFVSSEALNQPPRGTWILRLSTEQRWSTDLALDYYSGWNLCCRDCFYFFICFNLWVRQAVCDSQLWTEFFSNQSLALRRGRNEGKYKWLVQTYGPRSAQKMETWRRLTSIDDMDTQSKNVKRIRDIHTYFFVPRKVK